MNTQQQLEELMAVALKHLDEGREHLIKKDFEGAKQFLHLASCDCDFATLLPNQSNAQS